MAIESPGMVIGPSLSPPSPSATPSATPNKTTGKAQTTSSALVMPLSTHPR